MCLNLGLFSTLRKNTLTKEGMLPIYAYWCLFHRMPDPDFTVNDVKMCVGKF